MKEEWRPVTFEDYSHLYHVSNLGRVKSLRRLKSKMGGIMSASPTTCGYPSLTLRNNGKTKHVSVHILVARAFIGDPSPGMEVDHIDQDKTNNTATNLRYVTHRQNQNNHPAIRAKSKRKNFSSKYVGVFWFTAREKWGAAIQVCGKRHFLGLFEKEQEAADAYAQKAKELRSKLAKDHPQ